jgi:hypothetical protein
LDDDDALELFTAWDMSLGQTVAGGHRPVIQGGGVLELLRSGTGQDGVACAVANTSINAADDTLGKCFFTKVIHHNRNNAPRPAELSSAAGTVCIHGDR